MPRKVSPHYDDHDGRVDGYAAHRSRVWRDLKGEVHNMAKASFARGLLLLAVGGILGAICATAWEHSTALAQRDTPQANPATLQTDVAHLKEITPPNSHPMVDVAMFAANLWFAGQRRNWPLANYYLGEM